MMTFRSTFVPLLLILTSASPALADTRSDARAEYERGKKAHARQDYAEAAHAFAQADEILPSAVSLQAAIEEATRAEDAQLALALCERADRRADSTPALTRAVEQARAHFPAPVAPAPTPEPTPAPVVPPSEATPAVTPAPAPTQPPLPPPVSERRSGLSPVWFWTGVGVSGALAVATLATGALTASTHGSFEDERCAQLDAGHCGDLAARGRTLQTLGLGLLAGTALISVTTVAIGVFATDWKGKPRVSIAPTRGGGYVSATVAF